MQGQPAVEEHRLRSALSESRGRVRIAFRSTSTAHLPPAEYYASLPKHIAGAGAIIHDVAGRILLVQPSYRDDTWEIPGGGLDMGENPRQAVQREIKEELGFDLTPGRLLVVDWVPEQPDGRPPLVNFLFDGGLITKNEAQTRSRSQWVGRVLRRVHRPPGGLGARSDRGHPAGLGRRGAERVTQDRAPRMTAAAPPGLRTRPRHSCVHEFQFWPDFWMNVNQEEPSSSAPIHSPGLDLVPRALRGPLRPQDGQSGTLRFAQPVPSCFGVGDPHSPPHAVLLALEDKPSDVGALHDVCRRVRRTDAGL
ncbi:NUDIX domain-containing protein [Streptomyces sp. NPDC098085]|uniref:NUDIX domain-containing protein n=1 Tax=Streptomyces sp. NPDC098085 TaxID=3366094 RepID=UPI003805A0A5